MNAKRSASQRWIALVCMAAMCAGCETMTWPLRERTDDGQVLSSPPGPGLVASDSSRIADVPMPVGFVAVPSRSSSFVPPSGPRMVNHVYQGLGTVADATQFYRQHLPGHGWQFSRERSDGSITTMAYFKGQEELSVQISHPRVLDVVVTIRDRNTTAAAGVKP